MSLFNLESLFPFQHPFRHLKPDNYYAFICSTPPGILSVSVIDCETEKLLPLHSYYATDFMKFAREIPLIFKDKFKAVVSCHSNFCPPEFESNLIFCHTVREQFEVAKVPNFFTTDQNILLTNLLIAANISPKTDDIVTIITVNGKNSLKIGKLKYTENGYEKSMICLTPEMQEKNVEKFREQILGEENAVKKTILYSSKAGSPLFKLLRNSVLKSKKLIAIEKNIEEYIDKTVVEILKWLKDKSYTKFHIIPTCTKKYIITNKPDNFDNPLLIVDPSEKLPLVKECFSMDSDNVYIYANYVDTQMDLILSFNSTFYTPCKGIVFKVDIEGFPLSDIEQFDTYGAYLKPFTIMLDNLNIEKQPYIIFFQIYSFVRIFDDGKYKFMEAWNGKFEEVFIELNDNKLSINKINNPDVGISFALRDLINITTMAPDKIVTDEKWKFEITKDSENPVLLEFKSSDGTKNVTTPSFLMAYLLKQQIKGIEKATSIRPQKIDICMYDKYDDDEKKRIKEQFVESCNILSSASPKYECECNVNFFKL
uniref:Uncharacterized protein n=1 Tax=Panagrolaimus sp. ES5 TaxID=591445 RepID=A0AC34FD46_9BILA